MKKTAAQLAVFALEELGITHTFGIPGVHNTELYDELRLSEKITPMLVVHEQGGAFMAEGMSRLGTGGNIGTLAIVPAAGFTHAASGIGEAFLAGVPLLVITGGIRRDTPWQFKLHDVDQMELAKGITKAAFRVTRHEDVIPTIYRAYEIARSGLPGPVLVELPVDLQIFTGSVGKMPRPQPLKPPSLPAEDLLREAAELLQSGKVGIFAGYGARGATAELMALADCLQAPVATTLQGLSAFPGDHPLHAGFGFGPSAVPAAQNAFRQIDTLLTVGARFAEIPTGSFGVRVPKRHIHIDIDKKAVNANFPAKVGLIGDAQPIVALLLQKLKAKAENTALKEQIAADKAAYLQSWLNHDSKGRINPAQFFQGCLKTFPPDAVTVIDDGNHTFLTAELFTVRTGGTLIGPSDFNAMGYAAPAAIGAKLAQPAREVFAVIGDGCFAMTGMEIATAAAHGIGIVFFVFNDGELAQIAQAQAIPYQRKSCTTLSPIDFAGMAQAVGAAYLKMDNAAAIAETIQAARKTAAQGQPVIVDVMIDYSKSTAFTLGTTKTNLGTFALMQKLRFAKRMIQRKYFDKNTEK